MERDDRCQTTKARVPQAAFAIAMQSLAPLRTNSLSEFA